MPSGRGASSRSVERHAAWFVEGGLNVMDIWESEDHFNRFIEARVAAVLKGEPGVRSDPEPQFHPLRRRFVTPGVSGASS